MTTGGLSSTLGERLTGGESRDLALSLPEPFAEALVETGDGEASACSFDEFAARLAIARASRRRK